jgi:alpha-L-fucosidase
LNFPVDKEGLVHPIDSANVIAFYKKIQDQLKTNVLAGVVPKVSNTRGGAFKAKALTDGDYDTYWATDDEVTAATITFTMPEITKMNRLMLQEYIPLGQRVKTFSVSYLDNGKWLPIKLMEETTTIGFKRLLRFQTIETNKIRIEINDARGSICLNNIEAFYAGETTDISFEEKLEDIQSLPLTLVGVDESEAAKATDKNASTVCFVDGNTVVFDLGEEKAFRSFFYLPNQEVDFKGVVTHYELAVGSTPEHINKVVAKGEFANIKNNPILQSFYFAPTKARYVQLKAIKLVKKDNTISFAEIGVQ